MHDEERKPIAIPKTTIIIIVLCILWERERNVQENNFKGNEDICIVFTLYLDNKEQMERWEDEEEVHKPTNNTLNRRRECDLFNPRFVVSILLLTPTYLTMIRDILLLYQSNYV